MSTLFSQRNLKSDFPMQILVRFYENRVWIQYPSLQAKPICSSQSTPIQKCAAQHDIKTGYPPFKIELLSVVQNQLYHGIKKYNNKKQFLTNINIKPADKTQKNLSEYFEFSFSFNKVISTGKAKIMVMRYRQVNICKDLRLRIVNRIVQNQKAQIESRDEDNIIIKRGDKCTNFCNSSDCIGSLLRAEIETNRYSYYRDEQQVNY
ncbi:hypothetical protein TTHERM_00077770 (macronuclear) [Tetrahymena thermophila SB210]|uniref:Uncharacterized protein n=1 Tax=Tetrahymena thermophila (strain SB210) TaxID=312017 RepID=Q23FY8_TETTS|nr:hypothetical protein TTHERM_00077770 [Tetrahymena thermophila SB210]EAR95472.2 hypothetical protein TTHERM_00077770 [Tetrahymena thermophila SB210]|eukprot:XP_001015717.2 hypothetical protein TTHERM_00077770 [Tetrahymena thermophila SB210]